MDIKNCISSMGLLKSLRDQFSFIIILQSITYLPNRWIIGKGGYLDENIQVIWRQIFGGDFYGA